MTALEACAESKGKNCNIEGLLSEGYLAYIQKVYLDSRVNNSTGALEFLINQVGVGAALHAASKALNSNITLTCGEFLPMFAEKFLVTE